MQKNLLIAMLFISAFVFITAISSLYVEVHIISGNVCGCAIPIWLFIQLLGSLGLFIGALIYSVLKPRENEKLSFENLKNMILKFVSSQEEKQILKIILEKKKVKQYELSKLTNLDKVKIHRILKKLQQQGIIEKEKMGKVYVVKLSENLFE